VELHGNYTDSQVADKLYLNDLRGRYTFTDVTMP
jgi:hypothetical protein